MVREYRHLNRSKNNFFIITDSPGEKMVIKYRDKVGIGLADIPIYSLNMGDFLHSADRLSRGSSK